MTGKYYQGEDILITISLYNNKEMTEKVNLANYDVDLMIVGSDSSTLIASTDSSSDIADSTITVVDDYSLRAHFAPSLTSKLAVGNARVEVKMVDQDSGYTMISTNDSVFIENSDIGKLY
ncbi:MAG: hypothetical protein R3Y04_05495 [Rikenellaceae bacterium]